MLNMKISLFSLLAATAMIISSVHANGYIAFYGDSNCRDMVGSVAYSMTNKGCFANGGPYMAVTDDYSGSNYKLIVNQNKNSDCKGPNQATASFATVRTGGCHDLAKSGFITGGNGQGHPYNIHVEKV